MLSRSPRLLLSAASFASRTSPLALGARRCQLPLFRTRIAFSRPPRPPPSHSSLLRSSFSTLPRPQRKFWTRRKLILLGVASIAAIGYVAFPKHNYPAEVADLIRLGLYAERKESDPDRYATALDYYLAALEVADKLGMDKSSVEYTGLQIKAASMLELMGAEQQAFGIYKQLLQFGTEWAVGEISGRGSALSLFSLPAAQTLTYLRVCVRGLELAESVTDKIEMLHYTALWIDVTQGWLPDQYHDILQTRAVSWLKDLQQTQNLETKLIDDTSAEILDFDSLGSVTPVDESPDQYSFPLFPSTEEIDKFQKWRVTDDVDDTLLLARDFFATACIELLLPNIGLQIKKENVRLMQMYGLSLPRILRTEVDICSGYYIAYELSTTSDDPAKQARGLKLLGTARECYKDILRSIEEIRSSPTERIDYTPEDYEDLEVSNSLTVYGLGVIEAKQKNYSEAMRLFKEARSRALVAKLPALVDRIKEEWDQLVAEMTADQITDRDTIADALQYLGALKDASPSI